jgi:P pilus assembly chaperone PapD
MSFSHGILNDVEVKEVFNSKYKIAPRLLLVGVLLVLSKVSHAQLVLDKVVVVFDDPKKVKHDVLVTNESADERLFVSVEPFEVKNPGTAERELISLKGSEAPSFLTTPDKLIVEPGSSSVVRLLNLQPDAGKERVYRINFLPIKKPPEFESSETDKVAPMVEILVAYQVLAIVLPANAEAKPGITRKGKVLTLVNNGNANFLLSSGQQCDPLDPGRCIDLPGKRVYADSQVTMDLPFDAPATFVLKTSSGFRDLVTP